MKQYLSYFLAFTLCQPWVAWGALSSKTKIEQWQKIVSETKITTNKPITFKEMYLKMQPYLSKEERVQWFSALQIHFDKRLPQMGAKSKKLFYNSKNSSITFELVDNEGVAYKVNGTAVGPRFCESRILRQVALTS